MTLLFRLTDSQMGGHRHAIYGELRIPIVMCGVIDVGAADWFGEYHTPRRNDSVLHKEPTNEVMFVAKTRFVVSVGDKEQSGILDSTCCQNDILLWTLKRTPARLRTWTRWTWLVVSAGLQLDDVRMQNGYNVTGLGDFTAVIPSEAHWRAKLANLGCHQPLVERQNLETR